MGTNFELFQYIIQVKIDNTVVNEHIVDNCIQELKNVRVLARSSSFYQPADVRIRNLFYTSGKQMPGSLSIKFGISCNDKLLA